MKNSSCSSNSSFTCNTTLSLSPFPKYYYLNFLLSETSEFHLISIFFLLVPLCLAFLILYKTRVKRAPAPLPPGPNPWPIIGNLPELVMNRPAYRWIHGLMEELNTEIACVKLGNVHVISVTSPELAREFFKKNDAVFATRPVTMASDHLSDGFHTTVLTPSGEQWKKMRRVIVSEVLKPARLAWLLEKRTEEADNLVWFVYNQCKSAAAAVNMRSAIRQYSGNVGRKMIFGRRYFGEGRKDGGPGLEEEEHVDAIFTSLAYVYSFSPSDYLPCLRLFDLDGHKRIVKRAIESMRKYHDPIIDERIAQWRNGERKELQDILDVLITMKDSKGEEPLLSIQEIKAQVVELNMAMIDNPAQAVEWALAEMINQPDTMQKAVEEIDRVVGKDRLVQESDIPQLNYVKACAREALRIHPMTAFNLPHVAMADSIIGGYFIPKGSHVMLSRSGLGRNPRVWEDPLTFKPERHMDDEKVEIAEPELRFITFSIGRRGCPGITLGTTVTGMMLARLLQCFSWSAPPNEVVDLKESAEDFFLEKPLHASAKPRLHASMYVGIDST